MVKTIRAQSGHTMHVQSIDEEAMPDFKHKKGYTKFYRVRNFSKNGIVFMYLGKGNPDAPREIVVWYRNGGFWSSYGKTLKEAIDGAQRDGWLYA